MSIIGVSVSVSPWKLVGAEPSIQRFRLPPASVHIPHGNFATAALDKLTIPEFGLECTVEQFMRNGITCSDEDLTICSFQRGTQLLLICFTANGKSFTEGEIQGLRVNIDLSNRNFFSVQQNLN